MVLPNILVDPIMYLVFRLGETYGSWRGSWVGDTRGGSTGFLRVHGDGLVGGGGHQRIAPWRLLEEENQLEAEQPTGEPWWKGWIQPLELAG